MKNNLFSRRLNIIWMLGELCIDQEKNYYGRRKINGGGSKAPFWNLMFCRYFYGFCTYSFASKLISNDLRAKFSLFADF